LERWEELAMLAVVVRARDEFKTSLKERKRFAIWA
jgi:hypothetical protein